MFTGAMVGVVPACHGSNPPEVIVLAVQGFNGGAGGTGGTATADGSGGAGGSSAGSGGTSGSAGVSAAPTATPTPSASAVEVVPKKRPPNEPHVIVLAVQGFKGKGPAAGY
ncbi:MAG TPA: hypothetical protein VH062_29175 [Polyangiaceae bacterium]|nr:hypothetical protein [Polyangiaceae bacterium]